MWDRHFALNNKIKKRNNKFRNNKFKNNRTQNGCYSKD